MRHAACLDLKLKRTAPFFEMTQFFLASEAHLIIASGVYVRCAAWCRCEVQQHFTPRRPGSVPLSGARVGIGLYWTQRRQSCSVQQRACQEATTSHLQLPSYRERPAGLAVYAGGRSQGKCEVGAFDFEGEWLTGSFSVRLFGLDHALGPYLLPRPSLPTLLLFSKYFFVRTDPRPLLECTGCMSKKSNLDSRPRILYFLHLSFMNSRL